MAALLICSSLADDTDPLNQPPKAMTVRLYVAYPKEQSRLIGEYLKNCMRVYIDNLNRENPKTPQEIEHHEKVSQFVDKLMVVRLPLSLTTRPCLDFLAA
jgi:hypothetical protein